LPGIEERNENGVLARAVKQAIVVALLGASLGVIANVLAPWRIAWVAQCRTLPAAPDSLLVAPYGSPRNEARGRVEPLSITLGQAKALFDRRRAIFLDARPPYEYAVAHIPGAVNIPWEEIEYYAAQVERMPTDTTVILYCAGESCDLSIHLGDHLAQRGFTRVRVFFGGWLAWTDAGYPVEPRRGR